MHPNQTDCKKQLVVKTVNLLGAGMAAVADHEQVQQRLHAKIGQLTIEKDSFATTLGTGR